MAIQRLKLKLVADRPMIMHNARLADPLDPASKALKSVTSKRTKTDEDHEEAAKLEFLGSLYLDDDNCAVIPADNVAACFIEGAKKSKKGKTFKESVWFDAVHFVLDYDGPKTPLALYADSRFRFRRSAQVGTSRVMRTRPRFPAWSLTVEFTYDAAQLNKEDVLRAVEDAGRYAGLGDWRPQYGRFRVESL